MCMEDIRIGRKTSSNSYAVAIGAAVTEIVPRNNKRVALVIGIKPGDVLIGVSMDNRVAANEGMCIKEEAGPLILNIHDHGAMVLGPWYSNSGAGLTAQITETLLESE